MHLQITTNHYKPLQITTNYQSHPQTTNHLLPYRHSVFYIPIHPYPSRLPLPDKKFCIVHKSRTYCLTSATLRFTLSSLPPTIPSTTPLTPTDVVSSPATETCGLSLVSSPHLRADGLLPAATKPAQLRWDKIKGHCTYNIQYPLHSFIYFLFTF